MKVYAVCDHSDYYVEEFLHVHMTQKSAEAHLALIKGKYDDMSYYICEFDVSDEAYDDKESALNARA